MSKRASVAILKAREQESKRSAPNAAKPKKAARSQPSPIASRDAKPAKTARFLQPSRCTNQSLKSGGEPVKEESVLKRLAVDGIPSQSPRTCEIAHARAEQFEQQIQDYKEVVHTDTVPIDIEENRKPRTCKIAHAHAQQFEHRRQDYGEVKDTDTTPIDIEENREPSTSEIAVQFEEQMQDYREVEDKETTPTDIEENENQEVEPLRLQIYGTNVETTNETSSGSETRSAINAALSLEEYYLSGRKMIAPAVHDFIGPVKIIKVGGGRGRGLVLTRDVAAGDLLLISNHIAKVNKVKTEISSNFALEAGCWTASHHVLAEQLVEILSSKALRSSHNRALLSTLGSRGGEELPVPPMRLFHHDLTPRNIIKETAHLFNRARLCGVVQCNAFGHTHISRQNNNITRSWSCGLWTLPSFMNHSCIPNVATILIGDALIVVASRTLKCGDELTVAYFDIFRPLQERRASMLHSWNFVCKCARCVLEETLHETLTQITQAYSLREAEAALTVQILRRNDQILRRNEQILRRNEQSSTAWSPKLYSVIDLAQLAEYIEELLDGKRLSRDRKNWIRASFLSAYLADGQRLLVDVRGLEEPRRRKHARQTHIQTALAAANTVTPGHPQTLQIAAVVLKRAVQAYGRRSFLVENARTRALAVCSRLFGRLREEVLESIVDAAAADVLVSSVVFLSGPDAGG